LDKQVRITWLGRAACFGSVSTFQIVLLPVFQGQFPKAKLIATGWWGKGFLGRGGS